MTYSRCLSVAALLSCVSVAVPVPRALTKSDVIALAAFAVFGIKTITLFAPTRVSVNVVEVAFAVSVIEPVLFDLPSTKLRMTFAVVRASVPPGGTLG